VLGELLAAAVVGGEVDREAVVALLQQQRVAGVGADMLKVVSQLRSMKTRALGRSSGRFGPSLWTFVRNRPDFADLLVEVLVDMAVEQVAECMT
jgi:hypothetical protein